MHIRCCLAFCELLCRCISSIPLYFFSHLPPPPTSLPLALTHMHIAHTRHIKVNTFPTMTANNPKKASLATIAFPNCKRRSKYEWNLQKWTFFIVGRKNFRKCVCVFGRFHLRRSFRTLCIHKEICKICIEWVCNEFMHRKLHGYIGGCSLVNLHYESRFVCVYRIVLSWLLPPHRNMNAGIELKHTASFPIKNGMNVFSNNSALFLLFFISIVIL